MSERIFDVELKTALEKYLCLNCLSLCSDESHFAEGTSTGSASRAPPRRVAVARLVCSVPSPKDSVCVPCFFFFFFFNLFLAAWTNLLLEMTNLLQHSVELGSGVTSELGELGLACLLH